MSDDDRYATLDFHFALNSPRQRGRYRVAVQGLSLYLDDVSQRFDIRDLSSTGCNLCAPAKLLAVGRIFDGDLHISDTCYLAGLKIKVVRHVAGNSVACVFQALTRQQEIMLDKLLLEIQKRGIATYAAQRKREKNRCRNTLR